jgi:outer membrane receptor protein involved in Fe transport
LTATAGVRAFHDTVSAFTSSTGILGGGAPLTNGSSYTRATPKFVLTYAVSPRAMVYVQASEGYRVGQANLSPPKDPVSGQLIPGSYGPDQLWNYEAGFKTKLFDSRLTADGAAYYIDWKNIQLQQSTVPSGFVFTNNAGDAVIKGVEIELNAHPTEPLSLGVSLSYDQGRLTRVNPGVVATVGDQLPGSAPFTGYAYAKYDFPLGAKAKGYVRADYKYVSKEYADLHNATSLQYGDYGSVNAEAGLSVGRTEVMLFVNNLTNGAAIVNARELFAVPTAFRQQPRTVGITLRAHL